MVNRNGIWAREGQLHAFKNLFCLSVTVRSVVHPPARRSSPQNKNVGRETNAHGGKCQTVCGGGRGGVGNHQLGARKAGSPGEMGRFQCSG